MSSIFKLQDGESLEFRRRLDAAGISAQIATQVNKESLSLDGLKNFITSPREARSAFLNYFVTAIEQFQNIYFWNREYHWYDEAEVMKAFPSREIIESQQVFIKGGCLKTYVLVPYPGTQDMMLARFWSLLTLIKSIHPNANIPPLWNEQARYRFSDEKFNFAYTNIGLRWELLDLECNREGAFGKEMKKNSPNLALLAAAAHFPNWLRSMNGVEVPYVYLTGMSISETPGNGLEFMEINGGLDGDHKPNVYVDFHSERQFNLRNGDKEYNKSFRSKYSLPEFVA